MNSLYKSALRIVVDDIIDGNISGKMFLSMNEQDQLRVLTNGVIITKLSAQHLCACIIMLQRVCLYYT